MTTPKIVGLVFVIAGLVSLLLGGFSWNQTKTIVDIGPIEAHSTERKTLPIPPVIGGLLMVGGVVLLLVPNRRRV